MCSLNERPARLATSSTTIMRDKNNNGLLRVRKRVGDQFLPHLYLYLIWGGIFPDYYRHVRTGQG
jgi:hypothetical protein